MHFGDIFFDDIFFFFYIGSMTEFVYPTLNQEALPSRNLWQ
jgi:hypothetical protein